MRVDNSCGGEVRTVVPSVPRWRLVKGQFPMVKTFIPTKDLEFGNFARHFARTLMQDPSAYRCTRDEAQSVLDAVERYEQAYQANSDKRARSKITSERKDEARAEAKQLIRDLANRIRIDRQIDPVAKKLINVKERPKRLRRRECPKTAPALWLDRTRQSEWASEGRHVLKFCDQEPTTTYKGKPEGAVRVELFAVDVPHGEKVPQWPRKSSVGWDGYVRSFSRSPIEVRYPKVTQGACRVYWVRWASATGETGPLSAALVVRLENWSGEVLALPAPEDAQIEQRVTVTSARRELPDCVETFQTLTAERARKLPAPKPEAA